MDCRRILIVGILSLAGCGAEPGVSSSGASVDQPAREVPAEPPADSQGSMAERKIIYTATFALIVEDFAQTEQSMATLVGDTGGYISSYREDRRYGGALGGHWVVRIPVARFDRFRNEVLELGLPTSRQIDAQDVTEQFVDLSARLKNKQQLEQRVLKLLEERTGEIKEVIEVETQLGRVREEVEVLEGKIRYLSDQTAMTTVTISAHEDKSYLPPQAPTFAAKVRQTFSRSFNGLLRVGEGLALALVAIAPWLLVGGMVLLPPTLWWWRRRKST